ncbi:MAG: metallophosphoesterase, partial [Candidatus Hydrogenedentales bacterium]
MSKQRPKRVRSRVGYVVSDLHLFSRRSDYSVHERHIFQAAAKADVFVLNGDTFDFRWTTLPSIDLTVVAAIRWLRALTERFPNCYFHFILGNHD